MWCLDVDWETKNFLSGAADNTIRLWDVSTGKMLNRIDTKSAVRTCCFAYSGNLTAYSTDKQMGQPCIISVVDVRDFSNGKYEKLLFAKRVSNVCFSLFLTDKPILTIPIPPKGPKVTSMVWGTLDQQLITGHDNGDIVQWDAKTHQKLNLVSDHEKSISDIQLSRDREFNIVNVIFFFSVCAIC